MNSNCGCSGTKQVRMRNGQEVLLRKRCITWYEPVCRQPRRQCCNQMEALSVQMINSCSTTLLANDPIVFDEILFRDSAAMCCQEDTGVIELSRVGTYLIDWDVAIDCCKLTNFARFGVEVNGAVGATSVLPGTKGQLTGRAVVEVKTVPTRVRLLNDTGADVTLSGNSPCANLTVTTLR